MTQPAHAPPERTSFTSLVGIADYRRLWAIGAGVGIARWLEFLALSVYAYQLTQSPPLVALLAIVRMVPYVVLGFLVGALADLADRRRLLITSFVLAAGAAALTASIASLGLAGYGTVLFASAVSGAVWVVDMPVRRRLMIEAVGAGRMAAALGFDNTSSYATRAIGPIAGGAAYQWLGIEGVFLLTTLVYGGCLWLSTRIAPEARPAGDPRRHVSVLSLLLPPRRLVTSRPFQIVLGVTAVYNLWCFPFITMVPVIAQKDFALAPSLVGLLSAADGIGGTLGALLVGLLGSQRTLFRTYYWGTLSFLGLILAMSLWLTVWSVPACLLLTGASAACFSATQYALVYTIAPPEMRGRATGFLSIFIGLSTLGFYNTGFLFSRYASVDAMRIMVLEGMIPMLLLGGAWWWTRSQQVLGTRL